MRSYTRSADATLCWAMCRHSSTDPPSLDRRSELASSRGSRQEAVEPSSFVLKRFDVERTGITARLAFLDSRAKPRQLLLVRLLRLLQKPKSILDDRVRRRVLAGLHLRLDEPSQVVGD